MVGLASIIWRTLQLSIIIAIVGTILQGVLLVRFVWNNQLREYSFFLVYLAGSFAGSMVLYVISLKTYGSYSDWYWGIQILTLILGCGIMLEIFKHTLAHYPGAERFAMAAVILILGITLCIALLRTLLTSRSSALALNFELERDLRLVQALLLFSLTAIIFSYRIAVGRNMKGMIVGYGLYIGASLVSLAVRFYAARPLPATWDVLLQQASYDLSLIVWLVALWSYRPNPAPAPSVHLEADYEALVASTRARMSSVRSHLGKAIGS
jgi:hypothetical protein